MLNHPGTEDQAPSSGRLVLPAPPDETPHSSPFSQNPRVEPGQLIRRQTSSVPTELLPKIIYYWRKDPAYKVFMIAIGLVVLAAIVFASLGSATLLGKPTSSSITTNPPTGLAPKGTVDLRPTFTKPNGGSGSGQTSQPPAQGTTTIINVTPSPTASLTPQPTQPGQGGPLTLAITSYPPTVTSGTRVDITISTNQPGVTVSLEVRSNAQPRNYIAGSATTDANGNATISWFVFFIGTTHKVTATLTAIAQDQQGQQVASNPVTVQVIVQRMG
jgi:hypothetical protein